MAQNVSSNGENAAGTHVLDEAERSLHDALCVLSQTVQDARVVYGGGFPEMQMAKVSHMSCPQDSRLGSFGKEGPQHTLS